MSLLQNSLRVTHGLLGSSAIRGCRSAPASHCSNSNTEGHQLCENPVWIPEKAAVDTTASGSYNSPRAGFVSYLTTPFIKVSFRGRLQQVALWWAWAKGQVCSDCSTVDAGVSSWCESLRRSSYAAAAQKKHIGGKSHERKPPGKMTAGLGSPAKELHAFIWLSVSLLWPI